jgi:hypothetical protein
MARKGKTKAERQAALAQVSEPIAEVVTADRSLPHEQPVVEQAFEPILDVEGTEQDEPTIVQDEPTAPAAEVTDGNIPRSDKGVPLDGGQAHAEKFTAADCPYSSEEGADGEEDEYDEFIRWNEEFDAHADEAEEEKPGSVVKEEYRARYAEMGHPTHCGDDMAVILNNLCQTTKNGTDLDRFETICNANGVSLAKYNRTTNGWQGRLRMTGRNLLAKRIYEAGGVMKTPVEGAEPEYQMSAEWMASRKFVKEAK